MPFTSGSKFPGKWPGALITLAAALGLWFLISADYKKTAIAEISRNLITINSYKTSQIAAWRDNHYRDTVLLSLHPFFGNIVSAEASNPGLRRAQLNTWLNDRLIQKRDSSLAFLSPKGAVIAATAGYSAGIEKDFTEAFAQASQKGTPLMTDLYLAADGRPRITKFSPMSGGRLDGKILCVLVINIDPETEFYPLLRATPSFFANTETLLVRKEGTDVLYLNELDYSKNSALKLKLPLSQTDLPAAKAITETYSGFFAGKDYRGIKVFSAIKPVEGSNWAVITKIDRDTILAPVKTREDLELALILLAAGLLYGGFYIIIHFREQVVQKIIQESEELLSATLRSIGDGVVTTDAAGLVTSLNSVAEHLTGWTTAEAKGRPAMEIFRIINAETRAATPNPVERALRENIAVGLANHTALIARDGTEYQVADSCAPIHDASGAIFGAVLVFRDVTEAYLRSEQLRQSEVKYRSLFDESRDAIMMIKPPSWDFTAANAAILEMFGAKNESDFTDHAPENLSPERQPDGSLSTEKSKEMIEHAMREGSSFFEWTHKRISGEEFPATVLLSRIGQDKNAFLQATVRDITERKRADDALKKSEEQVRILLNSIGESIYGIDLQGNCTFANPVCIKMLGHANQEELLGKNMHQLIHHSYPDGRPMPVEVCRIFQAFRANKTTHVDTEVLWKADGTCFPAEYWSHPQSVNGTVYGAVITFIDITERKKTEEALKQTAARLTLATRAGGVGVWEYDVINNTLTWDDSMYKIYGITKDTFGGAYESWRAGLHPEDRARGDAEIQMALSGEKDFDTIFRVVWPDGSVHDVRALAMVQRNDSGKPLRMLGTNWDITAQRQLEQTVKETAEIRSKFASMVSHELRSPLTAITLGISLILEDAVGLSGEHKSLLELVHGNASRLGRLINAVLDFQKIAAGKMPFDIHENDITDLLTTTARSMALLAENKGLTLTSDLTPDLPRARFDRDKITQVLTNLLSNAIAHTEKGSVTVHAGCEEDKLHISVRDTGHGIKAEDLPKLFRAFEQLDSGGARRTGGTGLGLAISKEIILAHNGHIWAESEPGKGSVFHFTLPVKHGGK